MTQRPGAPLLYLLVLGLCSAPHVLRGQSPDQQHTLTDYPARKVEFRVANPDQNIPLSPVTTFPPHCSTDGSLYVDMLKPQDLREHTVVGIHGKSSITISPNAITDLHDIRVLDFFPSESSLAFLVHASKDTPGEKGSGKSPAGIRWDHYHDYIASFDTKGAYTGSVEVPTDYPNSHFALLPSGDALVLGFDATNSALQVAYIDASGKLVKKLDIPASRDRQALASAALSTGEMTAAGNQFVGSLFLTAFKDRILVWRRSNDAPVVEVAQGGVTREVPLPKLKGYKFVDLITSNDRWVAHFRSDDARPDDTTNRENFLYVDLRPQDGSISARIEEIGAVPFELACEADGKYIAFIYDKDNQLRLLAGE